MNLILHKFCQHYTVFTLLVCNVHFWYFENCILFVCVCLCISLCEPVRDLMALCCLSVNEMKMKEKRTKGGGDEVTSVDLTYTPHPTCCVPAAPPNRNTFLPIYQVTSISNQQFVSYYADTHTHGRDQNNILFRRFADAQGKLC